MNKRMNKLDKITLEYRDICDEVDSHIRDAKNLLPFDRPDLILENYEYVQKLFDQLSWKVEKANALASEVWHQALRKSK